MTDQPKLTAEELYNKTDQDCEHTFSEYDSCGHPCSECVIKVIRQAEDAVRQTNYKSIEPYEGIICNCTTKTKHSVNCNWPELAQAIREGKQ